MQTKAESHQFLTFIIENEIYGFDVLKTREVLEVPQITKMPKSLPFMAGVINLRGGIIPVVDLRIKFDLQESPVTKETSIIIVEVDYQSDTILIGALVDSVKKVVRMNDTDLEPPPQVGMSINTKFIQALGKYKDNLIIVLETNSLFSKEELTRFSDTVAAGNAEQSAEEKE